MCSSTCAASSTSRRSELLSRGRLRRPASPDNIDGRISSTSHFEGRDVLEGEKILITGATGKIGFPIARALASRNEVWGAAWLRQPEARDRLIAAGVEPLHWISFRRSGRTPNECHLRLSCGGRRKLTLLPPVERGVYAVQSKIAAPRVKIGADVLPCFRCAACTCCWNEAMHRCPRNWLRSRGLPGRGPLRRRTWIRRWPVRGPVKPSPTASLTTTRLPPPPG